MHDTGLKIEILEKQNTNLKFHVQEKINNLYEPKLIEANKPKFEFKKIDLHLALESCYYVKGLFRSIISP